MKRLIFILFSYITYAAAIWAVKAYPYPFEYTQPDGSRLKVTLHGNHQWNMLLSEEGLPLVSMPTGELKHIADRVACNPEIGRAVGLKSTRAQNSNVGLCKPALKAMGEVRTLVILCNFPNLKFSMADPKGFFTDMLNKPGFSEYGATGSVRDYFEYNSNGRFSPRFDVAGPVDLPQSRFHYAKNDYYGNEPYAHEMVIDAAAILDGEIDFSDYDTDGDGMVDNIFVIYAGKGEADTGMSGYVWPHSYELLKADPENVYKHDGVVLNSYACTNEMAGQYDRPAGIGTFVHEFGHIIGLPDLYSTILNDAFTPGEWSAMDTGPYNNEGRTPPCYSAYERYALGWIKPEPLPIGEISIEPINSSNSAFIAEVPGGTEYFLFENRQMQSWDSYLPGHGMLVWHIDYDPTIWESNTVNNNPDYQRVDLIEADNDLWPDSRDTDPFPTQFGYTSFTPETTPAFLAWDGDTAGFGITDIVENQGIIRANVASRLSNSEQISCNKTGYSIEGNRIRCTEQATLYNLQGVMLTHGTILNIPAKGIYLLQLSDGTCHRIAIK